MQASRLRGYRWSAHFGRVWIVPDRLLGFTPSPRQPLDRRDWCIEKIFSKKFRKKTGDLEKGYYQYLKFSIAQKKWLNFGCGRG
jgi:hypothetical protein